MVTIHVIVIIYITHRLVFLRYNISENYHQVKKKEWFQLSLTTWNEPVQWTGDRN
jgi:hypothetical protein